MFKLFCLIAIAIAVIQVAPSDGMSMGGCQGQSCRSGKTKLVVYASRKDKESSKGHHGHHGHHGSGRRRVSSSCACSADDDNCECRKPKMYKTENTHLSCECPEQPACNCPICPDGGVGIGGGGGVGIGGGDGVGIGGGGGGLESSLATFLPLLLSSIQPNAAIPGPQTIIVRQPELVPAVPVSTTGVTGGVTPTNPLAPAGTTQTPGATQPAGTAPLLPNALGNVQGILDQLTGNSPTGALPGTGALPPTGGLLGGLGL